MKIEDQVVNLQLSKKLKELGVKQESLFYWCEFEDEEPKVLQGIFEPYSYPKVIQKDWFRKDILLSSYFEGGHEWEDHSEEIKEIYSAFTVSELGEILPKNHFNFYKNEEGYLFSMAGSSNITSIKEADARSKMLIYLIENKLIKP